MKRTLKYLLAFILPAILVFYAIPVKKRSFEDWYGDGDPEVARSLAAFRARPLQSLEYAGLEWPYLVRGNGPRTLLFLHGMGGAADIWWQQIGALEPDFRIISLTLPAVHSLKEATAGINQILEAEKVGKLSLVGTSMGGYIAQYYLSQFPDRIERVVFGNTFPPNEIYRQENGGLRKLVPWLPEWLVMSQFRANISKTVSPASGYSPVVEAYLLEQYSGVMSKEQFIGRFDVVLDSFAIARGPAQEGVPKLILESDNDPLVPPELRARLRQAYPEAYVHTFSGTGHFTYLNEPEAYTRALRDFLLPFSDAQNEKAREMLAIFRAYFEAVASGSATRWDHSADTVRLWHDDKTGEPVLQVRGTAPAGPWKEWDVAMNARSGYDSLWFEPATNAVRGTFYEHNDFYGLIGKGPTRTLRTYAFNEAGKIAEIVIYWIPEANTTTAEHLKPVVAWALEHDSLEISQLYPGGRLVPSAENARRWKELLTRYHREAAQGN